MATPLQRPDISPVDALREAFDHTRRQLFPVRVEKWLVLGLLAFLEQCGRAWRGNGATWRRHAPLTPAAVPGDATDALRWIQTASEWLSAHAALVALALLAGVLAIALVAALVLWINARGVFMYLDDVVSGRADVARPWRQHADAASSYFGWSLGITLAGLFAVLFAAGLVVTAAMAVVSGRVHGTGGWLAAGAIAPVLALLLGALPLLALAGLALRDFVAPLQLATGQPCGAAARSLEALVLLHPGAFVLYLLLKLLLVIASGIVIVFGGCLTCCLGFLPVVMQIVFQPLFFFERAFPVFLLRQMGYDVSSRLS